MRSRRVTRRSAVENSLVLSGLLNVVDGRMLVKSTTRSVVAHSAHPRPVQPIGRG